ncbi:aldose 1-epimerase [Spirosoma harenae]
MPFQITTELLDTSNPSESFTAYVLQNQETGEFIRVIPEFGGILHKLVLRKGDQLVSLLKTPGSTQALQQDNTYASAFQFPFASRIPGGLYTFDGQQYALLINEIGHNNAIHGLVHKKLFTVADQTAIDAHASITLQYEYLGDVAGYPFPFRFQVTYTLTDYLSGSALSIRYNVTNTGTKHCPAGFGWHPYFTLGNSSVDDLTITLPARSAVMLDTDLQPVGYQPEEECSTIHLRSQELDNVYALTPTEIGTAETKLASPNDDLQLVIGQETGVGKLSYLICYTPSSRDCIAIEPQTANVNAFNTGDGLTILEPGVQLTGSIRVQLV